MRRAGVKMNASADFSSFGETSIATERPTSTASVRNAVPCSDCRRQRESTLLSAPPADTDFKQKVNIKNPSEQSEGFLFCCVLYFDAFGKGIKWILGFEACAKTSFGDCAKPKLRTLMPHRTDGALRVRRLALPRVLSDRFPSLLYSN